MEMGARTIAIFEFLHDKDMFQQAYTRLLQQRLLASREVYNVFANLELEHKFLHLLLEVSFSAARRLAPMALPVVRGACVHGACAP